MKNITPQQPCQLIFAALAALLFLGSQAGAQSIWQGVINVSATTNWSDTANWSSAAPPTDASLLFDNTGASTVDGQINSVVDVPENIAALAFANQSTLFHTVFVPGNVTVFNSGVLEVGTAAAVDSRFTKANFTGAGTLVQAGNMTVRNNCASSGGGLYALATLNLAGLSNFIFDNASGTIAVAGSGGEARPGGLLIMAGVSNFITAATLSLSTSTGNGNSGAGNNSGIRFGAGTNVVNVGVFNIVAGKTSLGSVGFAGSTGGLRLRGVNGAFDDESRANVTIGNRNNGGSGNVVATVDLTGGHPLDLKVETLAVGLGTSNPTGAQTCTARLFFDAGIVNATTVNIAANTVANVTTTGSIVVGGGTLIVSNLSLVRQTAGTLASTGTLTITNGGVVNVSGSLLKSTSAGTGNLTVHNGRLSVVESLGNLGAPINNVSFSNAILTLSASSAASANVTALTCGGTTNILNIYSVPAVLGYPAQFPIIKYAGALGGSFNCGLGTLPVATPAYAGYVSNNTANGSIDLVLTGGPQPARVITWRGTPSGNWDTTTANWAFAAVPTTYYQEDFVRFDDSASGTTTVDLTMTLLPSSVTVSNNTKTYGLAGGGILSGETPLTKDGSGTLYITNTGLNDFTGPISINSGTVRVGDGSINGNLGSSAIVNNGALVINRGDDYTLANGISGTGSISKLIPAALILPTANTFSGPVTVSEGTLRPAVGSALGNTNGATSVLSGAALDVNAQNLGAEPVVAQGNGTGGEGAIINSAGQQLNALRYVTLGGTTTVGGTGRWDIRSAPNTADPSGAALATGGNAFKLTKTGSNQISLVGVTVDPALGDVEVQQGILGIEHATTGLGDPAHSLTVLPGAAVELWALTNQLNKVITLTSDGGTASLINNNGANTIIGSISLLSPDTIALVNGVSLNLAGPLTGGVLTKQGTGNLILSGTPTHAGTVAFGGTVTVFGTHTPGLTNLAVLGAVAGTGTVLGFTDNGGYLHPGATNVAGTLTLSGLLLQPGATPAFDLTNTNTVGSGVNDLVVVNGNLEVNGNAIAINPLNILQTGVPYRLFNYTGILIENAPFNVPDVGGYTFTVSTATPGQVNLIAVGGPPLWNGGSASVNNRTDPANWRGVTIQPNDSLYFGGSTRLNNTNNTGPETPYTDLVFTPGAGAFTLNGDPITLLGSLVNNSTSTQSVRLGLNYSTGRTLNGAAGPLVIGGGVTNTAAGYNTLTLTGSGTLTNLWNNSAGGTNTLAMNGNSSSWTLLDNDTAAPMTGAWVLSINGGTFNFGSGSSAPVLTSTTPNGAPTDHQLGTVPGSVGVFNMVAGTWTTTARFNTGTDLNATGIVNQVGGTMNIGNMFQGANGVNDPNTRSILNLSGGTMNIGTAVAPNSVFYVTSRGIGDLTVSGTGALNCGILDLARNASGDAIKCVGVVNLDGGTIAATRVGTATAGAQAGVSFGPGATFNFNGGTLKARANSATFFQGSTVAPTIPIVSVVRVGGAVIDTDGFNVSVLEPLIHDSSIGGTPDGGLIKNGLGTLTLGAANTYTGPTVVNAGALLVNGSTGASAVTVESGGTIGGNGTISSSVLVKPGGTATAGAANATGTLTVAGNIMLQAGATAFMELNKTTASSDQLRAIAASPTTITYSGALALTNLAGTLASGDSFKLFSASNYVGTFSSITPATPAAGLMWNASALVTSGTISVALAPIPRITTFGMMGGNMVLSGTNGPANASYVVLTSLDVTLPLASWTPLGTNTFNGSGDFSFTNGPASDPQRYYLLQVQ